MSPKDEYTVTLTEGVYETRSCQMEITELLEIIEDYLQLEQPYWRYKQEKPLQI